MIKGLGLYLAENKVPSFYDKQRSTYLEYLSGRKVESGEIKEIAQQIDTNIDTSKDYSIMFVYTKDPSILSRRYLFDKAIKSNILGLYFYGTLGMYFGSGDSDGWQSAVVFAPYNEQEVKGLCQNMV